VAIYIPSSSEDATDELVSSRCAGDDGSLAPELVGPVGQRELGVEAVSRFVIVTTKRRIGEIEPRRVG
jgi:hypothetical protein